MSHINSRPDERAASIALCTLLAAAVVLLLIFFLTADFERVLSMIPDDAAYFFEIAENVARGAGETFDGLNDTNGYQPLWLYLLVPIYRLGGDSPEAICRFVLVLQIMLLVAAAALLYSTCVQFVPRRAVLFCGVLFLAFVLGPSINGMESAVLVLLLSVLVALGWRTGITAPASPERDLLFGMVMGLVVLARLDMIFLSCVVCALCLARAAAGRADRIAYVRMGVVIGIGTSLVLAPYLIRNHLVYGRIMPISGALKSSFPRATLSGYVFSRMGKRDVASLAVAIVYLAWIVVRALRSRVRGAAVDGAVKRPGNDVPRSYFEAAVAVLSAVVVLHFLHTALFMRWAVFRWHFLFYSFVAAVALCVPAGNVVSRLRSDRYRAACWVSIVLVAGFCCLFMGRRYLGRPDRGWIAASYRAALWAREHTDETDIFAMKDAGNFGHFSGRSVISLDGIVNDTAYQDALRDGRLNEYLDEMKVGYLVQHAFWDRDDITDGTYDTVSVAYTSRLYGVESGPLTLRREWEVYRSEPYFDGPYRTVFLIWKLPGGSDG